MKRRKFIKKSSLTGLGLIAISNYANPIQNEKSLIDQKDKPDIFPLVIATWDVKKATAKAWEVLLSGKTALDAVEQGTMVAEANENNQTVGIGGLPDRDGNVSLDACIMDEKGNYGAVVCIENIKHPVSVARKVMENTPHKILAGEGAKRFALESGFNTENLLTKSSRKAWEKWKQSSKYNPIINIENHDTIGMLAIDKNGDICGACTTSGLAYKMKGRVGDSAIIGSGLFIDNEIGGATATGLGEEILKSVGSFLIVELMRHGKTPQEACEEAIHRIVKKNPDYKNFQIGYIAVNKKGEIGSFAIHENFNYTLYQNNKNNNQISEFYNK
jgi:N4-(beta-N-acetylglucosaminyl)-L-asparaginase